MACAVITEALLAQSIRTVAGGGPLGDGRTATDALLRNPQDVHVDRQGNVYIADTDNHRVRRVDARTGVITTIAGGGTSGLGDGGPATAAEVLSPVGVEVDAAGNVYISSTGRIRKVDAATGVITTFAGGGAQPENPGDGGPATAAFLQPSRMTFDATGNFLYVADSGSSRVRRIDVRTGIITTIAGSTPGFGGDGGPAINARLNNPRDVAFDRDGNLYIADTVNHRVRKVDARTGLITTIAGNGEEGGGGDGLPATQASVWFPPGLTVDTQGNIYVISCCANVRKIDATTGIISTIAGGNPEGYGGDGDVATKARLNFPAALTFDGSSNLIIADRLNHRVRRVAAGTQIITTLAGGGSIGDGGPATSAQLLIPEGIAFDSAGNLYIADSDGYRVRKLSASTGVIATFAGNGDAAYRGDGGPATEASFFNPWGLAVDASDNVYIAARFGTIRKVDAKSGIITTVAGSDNPMRFTGDDPQPAINAGLNHPRGVAVDKDGNIYIADTVNHRVRKVSVSTGTLTTLAGTTVVRPPDFGGPGGFSGDGGPARAAELNYPTDVAVDAAGNVYIADAHNGRVRRIAASTGIITTIAGGGNSFPEGVPATDAQLGIVAKLAFDASGNLYVTSRSTVYRIDTRGIVNPVAGLSDPGYSGDGGLARLASLNNVQGIAVDPAGNIYFADQANNRIRVVSACPTSIAPAKLTSPSNGATTTTAPLLQWSAVPGALRYDVNLDTVDPPRTVAGQDLTTTAFALSNLTPGTKYYWQVVSKGDRFCPTFAFNYSEVFSFTTAAGCTAPGAFDTTVPPDRGTGVNLAVDLVWQAATGAASYDVYFGAANPPSLFASNINATKYAVAGLTPDTTYYWYVVAHAACDPAKTAQTPVRSFRTAGTCAAAGPFSITEPRDGAANVPFSVNLEWLPSANASGYELYFGTTTPPPIYFLDLSRTKLTISGLQPSTTYYWRVVAKVACDASKNLSTPVARFTTSASCTAPGASSITFLPPGAVGVGQTYTIAWTEAAGLDAGGLYVVERSLSPSFSTLVDSQETFSTSASFVSTAAGTYYHRVLAVAGCDRKRAAVSDVKPVNVVAGSANVIFAVQPQAVITALGEKLEDRRSTFTLENIGSTPLQVILGKGEINSVPFFTIVDPLGGDSVFVTLEPKKPKKFEIHFSGPPNDRAGAYQGIIFVAATGQGLAITPYAFVNLKVGGGPASRPLFLSDGRQTEYAFFPGLSGDDSTRPPISIDIRNDGGAPMELGAEIGPEVWLVPESGWNATPIPPGTTRTVRLRTQRSRAPNGSALPRYTYFTVRTRNGETARLLVQDNDAFATSSGRTSLLDPGTRSYVVPGIVSTASAYSRLRLTNVGSESIQTELYFTPSGADGFDPLQARRANIVIPPNDVVTLTDPLAQVFGMSRPAEGSVEVRAAPERIGFVLVSGSVLSPVSTGGAYRYDLPTFRLGEGARIGDPHVVQGVSVSPSIASRLHLVETSGIEPVRVRVRLDDAQGNQKGTTTLQITRYGQQTVDLGALAGGAVLEGARVTITAESGGGSVGGMVTMLDPVAGGGATIVSQPVSGSSRTGSLGAGKLDTQSITAVTPVVVHRPAGGGSSVSYRTTMGFSTGAGTATSAAVTYRPANPSATLIEKTIQIFPTVTLHFDNVLEQLFGVSATASATGSIFTTAPAGVQVYARVVSSAGIKGSGSLPIFGSASEVVASLASRRPLFLDGLEQSVDSSRGTRWDVVITETSGNGGSVRVRLYEAGNRSLPIAEKTFTIRPFEQLRLETVFTALDLDGELRRKDRTNVLCVVVPEAGAAAVSAVGVATDNATGDIKHYVFSPTGGVPATGVLRLTTVTAVTPQTSPVGGRRRSVRP
ncbi:MAG TPA: hypothetical protein VNL91_07690 [Thermoanaerobaculia bacterium]|nr:hypothetical protein [Thermoanaerobaculia bacterium]